MDSRFHRVILVLLLICLTILTGCISSTQVQDTKSPAHETTPAEITHPAAVETNAQKGGIADQLESVRSESPVWNEAYRMFRNMRSTEYVHPPYTVDETNGNYRFDCLGFVDHVLMNAAPAAYKEIGKGANPSIESYAAAFNKLDTKSPVALQGTKIVHPADLQPGDVCLWLKPSTLDTGHMWIIAGEPKINPKRTDEVLVRIFDSTGTVHTDDSRAGSAFKTGLGSGILGFMVDNEGNPVGLYWEGGASTSAGEKDTTIVCARLTR